MMIAKILVGYFVYAPHQISGVSEIGARAEGGTGWRIFCARLSRSIPVQCGEEDTQSSRN
jgi:hypothetical protein